MLEVARARAALAVAGRQENGALERGCGCGEALWRGAVEERNGKVGDTYGAETLCEGEARRRRFGCGEAVGGDAAPGEGGGGS